jgi:molecular chaperone GrpE
VNERDERNEEAQRVVIRDKRRIDPATGAARTPAEQVWTPPGAVKEDPGAIPAGSAGPPPGSGGDGGPVAGDTAAGAAPTDDAATGDAASWRAGQAPEAGDARLSDLTARVSELTNDLQRVTAEYANYRKRVERDRAMVAEVATGSVLAALLPVLDDLDRAREHGDLTGAFKAVADQMESALGKLGLTPVGEPGDRFDPTVHEAVSHQTSPEVTEPTCVAVFRRGFAHRDRLLRPALVAVADPGEPAGGGQQPAAAGPAPAESAGARSAPAGPVADAPGEQT